MYIFATCRYSTPFLLSSCPLKRKSSYLESLNRLIATSIYSKCSMISNWGIIKLFQWAAQTQLKTVRRRSMQMSRMARGLFKPRRFPFRLWFLTLLPRTNQRIMSIVLRSLQLYSISIYGPFRRSMTLAERYNTTTTLCTVIIRITYYNLVIR